VETEEEPKIIALTGTFLIPVWPAGDAPAWRNAAAMRAGKRSFGHLGPHLLVDQ